MTILSLLTLATWLCDPTNILRVSIDSSDFKNYIFGLLFLKRANYVYQEEVENIMTKKKLSQKNAEEERDIRIREESRWTVLTAKTENIGETLDKAFASIKRDIINCGNENH